MEGYHAVTRGPNGDLQRNPDVNPEEAEIDRLLHMAAYYQRLGCINVAVSLRALAEAKKNRHTGGLAPEEAV